MSAPSTPFPVGRAPICATSSGSETNRDELGQSRTVLVEDTERTITSAGHRAGLIDDMAQEDREVEVALNEQHGVEYPTQRGGVLDRTVRHQLISRLMAVETETIGTLMSDSTVRHRLRPR